MTTQELKQQIEKVLGNSIRCLLPSYWWKRLFHQVADRIDEVEQSTSELIEASKMPIVESESNLSQLDLPKGSVAAAREVGGSTVKMADCYFSTNREEDWEKYTIVKRVEEKANITIDKESTVWLSASKEGLSKDSFTVNMSDNGPYYGRAIDNMFISRTTLSKVNEALSSGNYRAVEGDGEPDQYFTFYSEIPRPELYIKGETWERIAKESELTSSIIVNSIDELNALDVPQGTIASVVVHQGYGNFANCYQSSEEELTENLESGTNRINEEYLNKLTRIYGVRLELPSEPFGETIETSVVQYNQDTVPSSRVGIMSFISDGTISGTYMKLFGSKVPVFNEDGSLNDEFFNETQLYYDYPAYHLETVGNGHLLSKVFVPIMDYSDVYVKGVTWEKLAKESDLEGTEDVGTSASGAEIREIYIYENLYDGTITELTDEQKAYNLETYELSKQGKAVVWVRTGDNKMQLPWFNENFRYQYGYSQPTDYGALAVEVQIDDTTGLSALKITNKPNDSLLSTTSENAVQNKVITAALNNKVDKVAGKQLSTEDFTTALKAKLEGLSNYDDTEISNAVARLRDDFDSLTQEDISAAIENFNEIISFLDGIEDSESLDSIIASIEQQIANKQDKLVSGTNIKTINGESILGEGNIVVNVDTSNLATKQELNAKQDVISDLETIRSGAALGATALQEHQDISHLATKEEVTNLQNEVIANEEVSAAAFNEINERIEQLSENVSGAAATKEELAEAVVTLNGSIATKADADSTSASIASLEESVSGINASLANYATKESLANEVETITNTIIENEEITATALTNLDARIKEIIARLDALES